MKEPISVEECLQLSQVMGKKYASALKDRNFFIKTQGMADGVMLTVILRNHSGSFHYPVEGRMKLGTEGLNSRDAALFLLDYIDQYFEEYLTRDPDTFLPIDWTDYELEGRHFQIRGQIANLELEKLADEILARGHSLLV